MNSNREDVIELLSEVTDNFWDNLGTNQLIYMGKELNDGYATLSDDSAIAPTKMTLHVNKSDNDRKFEQETLKVLNYYVGFIITYESIRQYLTRNSEFKVVFNLFESISIIFKSFKSFLTPKEKMDFIAELCKENLEVVSSNKDDVVYDLAKIKDLRNLNLCGESLSQFVFDREFPNIMRVQGEVTTEETKKTMKELTKRPQLYAFCDQGLLINNKIIKEHYLDKMNSYTIEDVEKIMEALEQLGIHNELCQLIKKALLAEVHKRLSKQASIEKQALEPCDFSREFSRVDTSERDRIYQEVEEAIDLRDMTLKEKRYVSLEERIEFVSKLFRIGVSRANIEKFLKQVETENNMHSSPFCTAYEEIREMLVYYAEKYGLTMAIQDMEVCFSEMNKAQNNTNLENYQTWRQLLEGEVSQFLFWIPKNHEYEIESGKKLLQESHHGRNKKHLK